jgi:SAM-dependent methyltransferase
MLGRDFYGEIYAADLDGQAKWLEYGAKEKADSIDLLTRHSGIKPISLLELGCGTGAVIKECARRNLASRYVAVDYAQNAVERLRSEAPGIECMTADIMDAGFHLDEPFDVVILSHVLEHLEDPAGFLRTIKRRLRFRYLIIEVPLEDLLLLRLKASVVSRNNPAGHVQFFTRESFKLLLDETGFAVAGERWFVPDMSAESIRFVCKKDGIGKIRTLYTLFTLCYLARILRPAWKRYWYSHLAVRCALKSPSPV